MFDKKLPCYFDAVREPDNYVMCINAITIDNLKKYKLEYFGITEDMDVPFTHMYYTFGQPQPFFQFSHFEDNVRNYIPGQETFIYPIYLYPFLLNTTAEGTIAYWKDYISIPDDVLDKVCNQNNGKICLVNVNEAFPLTAYTNIMGILLEKYSNWNLTKWHFIVVSCNEKIICDDIPLSVTNNLCNLRVFHKHIQDEIIEGIKNKKTRPNKFICLNRVSKPHRLAAISELWQDRNDGILTAMCVHYGDPGIEGFQKSIKEKPNDNENDKLNEFNHSDNQWAEYVKNNIMSDTVYNQYFKSDYPESYKKWENYNVAESMPCLIPEDISPIKNPVPDPMSAKFFESSLNIVTETYGQEYEQSIFLTDKIWKPITHYQPFVIIGARGHLRSLKRLGFQTFDTWIDENYDNIIDDQQRLNAAINSARRFYSRTREEIAEDMSQMIDIFLHNSNNYQTLFEHNRINLIVQIAKRLNYCNV